MEFQDGVRKRRMVRAFEERPVPSELVQRILSNAQRGPSSGFTQGFDFLVFEGPEETKRFWDATPWRGNFWAGARRAPLIIVPVAHPQAYVEGAGSHTGCQSETRTGEEKKQMVTSHTQG